MAPKATAAAAAARAGNGHGNGHQGLELDDDGLGNHCPGPAGLGVGARETTIELAVQGHAALLQLLLAQRKAEAGKRGGGEPEAVEAEIEGWKGGWGVGGMDGAWGVWTGAHMCVHVYIPTTPLHQNLQTRRTACSRRWRRSWTCRRCTRPRGWPRRR